MLAALALSCSLGVACDELKPAPAPAPSANAAPSAPVAQALPARSAASAYLDNTGRDDLGTGGVKMIPITTPKGTFKVWTKRVGNNPTVKVLLLHGGPGITHEIYEVFDSYFPGASIEYYYYDQLGSYYSDQPDHPELNDVARFVDEVEQVRTALHLDKENFFLFGASWGGILAMEYALKYQQHLKGLVISNMMSSIPEYNKYAETVLMPAMDPKVLAEIKKLEAQKRYADPRYMELLLPSYYAEHILRMPFDQWPEPVSRAFKHLNPKVYTPMQGPSEMGASGKLLKWNRTADLAKITVPTLVIGARHDTMDPKHMEMMAGAVKKGRFLLCPNGSHAALYDDRDIYMTGLLKFIDDVAQGRMLPRSTHRRACRVSFVSSQAARWRPATSAKRKPAPPVPPPPKGPQDAGHPASGRGPHEVGPRATPRHRKGPPAGGPEGGSL